MRATFPCLAAAALALTPIATAQGDTDKPTATQEVLSERRAQKLAKPVFENADWVREFGAAQTRAAIEKKFILAYFTRSYAPCSPCESLEKRVFATPEFAAWAKDSVVLFLHNTSHCDDEPNPDLLREKGGNGFPTVVYLSCDGRALKQLEFPTEMSTIENGLEQLEHWKALTAAAKTDPAARKKLFMLELENRMLDAAAARAQAAKLTLTASERRAVDQQLTDLEFTEILAATPRKRAAEAGAKFYAMLQEDRVPQTRQITTFWQYIFEHAMANKDAELFASCLEEMKNRHTGDARIRRYLPALEAQLKKLQGSESPASSGGTPRR